MTDVAAGAGASAGVDIRSALLQGRKIGLSGPVGRFVDACLHLLVDPGLVRAREETLLGQRGTEELDRVSFTPRGDLLGRPVLARIAGRMAAVSVRLGFDQGRSLPRARSLEGD